MKPVIKNTWVRQYGPLALSVIFFLFSFLFNKLYTSRSSVTREVKMAEKYLAAQEKDFDALLQDTALLGKLIDTRETEEEFSQLKKKKYGFFLYTTGDTNEPDMRFWSSQLAVPPPEIIAGPDSLFFTQLSNGWYMIRKKTISITGITSPVLAFSVVPVYIQFFLSTDYLPSKFAFGNELEKRVRISIDKVTEFPVKSSSGQPLFYLTRRVTVAVPFNDDITLYLRFAGVFFLLVFIQLFAERQSRRLGVWKGLAILTLILLTLRVITYYYPSLLNLRQFELFDPGIYGSNIIQRSLGDLLINSVLFCWVVLFAWSKLQHKEKMGDVIMQDTGWFKWLYAGLALCLLILSTFILSAVIRSMVADSKISFDVTNFFSLTQYTVFGFFILACLSLSYYYLSRLLFRLIFPVFAGRNFLVYFAVAFLGLVYLTTRSGNNEEVLFYIPVLLWLLCYTWVINRKGVIFNKVKLNIAAILSWIFIFSVSISVIMLSQNRKVERQRRLSIAEKLSVLTDKSSESSMSIAATYLDNDFFAGNFTRFLDEKSNASLRDSIVNNTFVGFLDRFDTRMYLFDSLNRPLYNEDPSTWESLNVIVNVQSRPTETEGIYSYETSVDKFTYIIRREIKDTLSRKMGTFFMVSNLKTYSRDALVPELFSQNKGVAPENSPIYSNAVYLNGKLIRQNGIYPFAVTLTKADIPVEETRTAVNGDFDELWYRANNDKTVIVARKKETTIEAITLFSYIFCSFLFLVAFVQLVIFVLRTGYNWQGFKKLWQMNIRSQVHSTIIFISVFSFLIIGFATISFFIIRNSQSNKEKLSRTMRIMVNEVEKKQSEHAIFDDVLSIYDSAANTELQKLVNDVAEIHGVDVNVYDLKGDLQVTSEANVYNRGVVSRKMDPKAFYFLHKKRQVLHTQEERIGSFSYLSIYSPVRTDSLETFSYINIPYFTSKSALRQEISNFLVTIINLNAFIFLIAGLIALFITNRITNSFSIISEKMRKVNLGKMNEQIDWNRNDEIGELVQEYNKMVAQLGESAAALAKSEREGAWREMARQVAHEIKNPLTPMKLSIQYLQKAIDNNQPNVKELSANVARTLVEQIDHLSKIAADFSQFANIGNTAVSEFDLHDVIASLKDLYSADDRVLFDWFPVNDRMMVKADKTQMNRLFTNLFANAVEACNGSSICRIELNEKRTGDILSISISDNGEGIAPEMQERIFMPNFTTKSSGTGLGLAMCKSIVEQAHGKIWFETRQGAGTTFFVELPLAE